ncbi:urea transporter 2-like [Antedon mediterranea]|uniref:urea transporter 2-like n=1 Tax=Antedon mediterranea TaxID=105859 RepID=UPI003AF72031
MEADGIVESPPSTTRYHFTHYFMGEIKPLKEWIKDKNIVFKFINACFRGMGQPVFLNNPISGLLVLAALFVQNPWQAINALLGLISAQLMSMVLCQDRGGVENGGFAFQGLLIGSIVTAISAEEDWYGWLSFPVVCLGAGSVFVSSALNNLFGRVSLPAFNLSFNLVTFLFVTATTHSNDFFPQKPVAATIPWIGNDVDWAEIFKGLPRGIGQCYGCDDVVSGCLVAAAMAICSPIILWHAIWGSFIGIIVGISLACPLDLLYNGVMGYNSVLTACSIGGVFMLISLRVHLLAIVSAVIAAVTSLALFQFLAVLGLPMLAFPFCAIAALFLLVTTEGDYFVKIPLDQVTWPEDHWKRYHRMNITVQNSNELM